MWAQEDLAGHSCFCVLPVLGARPGPPRGVCAPYSCSRVPCGGAAGTEQTHHPSTRGCGWPSFEVPAPLLACGDPGRCACASPGVPFPRPDPLGPAALQSASGFGDIGSPAVDCSGLSFPLPPLPSCLFSSSPPPSPPTEFCSRLGC